MDKFVLERIIAFLEASIVLHFNPVQLRVEMRNIARPSPFIVSTHIVGGIAHPFRSILAFIFLYSSEASMLSMLLGILPAWYLGGRFA